MSPDLCPLTPVPSLAPKASAEPCCPPEHCAYAVERIPKLLALRAELREIAETPRAALHQLEHEHQIEDRACEDPMARTPGGGPGDDHDGRMNWVAMVADLDRARDGGCSTPEDYALWLCPFSGVRVENIRDEGREARGE